MNLSNCTINSHYTNRFASNLGKVGSFLTIPTNVYLEQIAKVIRPIKPGHLDQLNGALKELSIRVCRLFLCCALAPFIVLGVLGLGLQGIASYSRRQFIVICPDKELPTKKGVKTIKIGTFNACMMLSWINILVHNFPPPRERVEAVAKGILESGVDVLCMQEAFNAEATSELIRRIKEKYPYIVYNADSHAVKLGSGLLIASQFPLENPRYWEHAMKIGTERLSCKGTIAATIRVNETHRIPIFNTHLEAGLDDPVKAVPCRVRQLEDIQRHMKEYGKGFATTFLCGDMNIPSQGGEADVAKLEELIPIDPHDPVRKRGTLHKGFPLLHSDPSCGCLQNTLPSHDIDHIGVHKSALKTPQKIDSCLKCFNGVSDHVAYIATFQLDPPHSERREEPM